MSKYSKKLCCTNRSLSYLVAPIDIPCYLRPKSKCSNSGQTNMGAPKSDSNRLVQHWFFDSLVIIQKFSEEKNHLF